MADNQKPTGHWPDGADGAAAFFAEVPVDMSNWLMMLPHFQANMARALLKQERDNFAFAQKRCGADVRLAESLSSTANIGDVFKVWLGLLNEASSQYAAHIRKLANSGATGAMTAMQPMSKGDAPLATGPRVHKTRSHEQAHTDAAARPAAWSAASA
jgi:hypothetical protein